jgi:hypothetical protein
MAGGFPDGRFHDDRDSSLSQAEYAQAGDAVDRRKACSAFDGSAGAIADEAGASSQGVPAPSPFAFVPVTEPCTICLASSISFIAGCFE